MDMEEVFMDAYQVDQLILEKVKVDLIDYISTAQLKNFDIETLKNSMTNAIVLKLRGFLMGEKLREERKDWKVSYPSSWWQMFKRQYFPKWLLKRFPVRHTTLKRKVVFKVYELYPKLPIAIPKYADRHFPIQICYTENIDKDQ
jgi:hypothetical protein